MKTWHFPLTADVTKHEHQNRLKPWQISIWKSIISHSFEALIPQHQCQMTQPTKTATGKRSPYGKHWQCTTNIKREGDRDSQQLFIIWWTDISIMLQRKSENWQFNPVSQHGQRQILTTITSVTTEVYNYKRWKIYKGFKRQHFEGWNQQTGVDWFLLCKLTNKNSISDMSYQKQLRQLEKNS